MKKVMEVGAVLGAVLLSACAGARLNPANAPNEANQPNKANAANAANMANSANSVNPAAANPPNPCQENDESDPCEGGRCALPTTTGARPLPTAPTSKGSAGTSQKGAVPSDEEGGVDPVVAIIAAVGIIAAIGVVSKA